jgi:hypothetical protein
METIGFVTFAKKSCFPRTFPAQLEKTAGGDEVVTKRTIFPVKCRAERFTLICLRIPTGFRTTAQGCAFRATLGNGPIE